MKRTMTFGEAIVAFGFNEAVKMLVKPAKAKRRKSKGGVK